MGKKNKSKKVPQSKPIQKNKQEISEEKAQKNSLVKTYAIIGGLILAYFFLTFSVSSVDKKMDKAANASTDIVYRLTVDKNLLFLSKGDQFLGITRTSQLPINRLSIKQSNTKSIEANDTDAIVYSFMGSSENNLVVGGSNTNYKQIIFTDISDENGSKVSKDVTIDIPNEDVFLVSAPYSSSYENVRIITTDDKIIEIK